MNRLSLLRWLFAVIAIAGYAANAAQAHVRLGVSHTISASLCGLGGERTLQITIGGGPAEELVDQCCGDCLTPAALTPEPLKFPRPVDQSPQRGAFACVYLVEARTPLWPGAPPIGPPSSHKA